MDSVIYTAWMALFCVKSLKYQAKSLNWWFYFRRKERKYLHKTYLPLHGLRVFYCLDAFKLQRTGCFIAAQFALVIIIWKSLMVLISFSTLLDFSTRVTLQYLVLIFMVARVLILISADIFFDTKSWGWVTGKANWGLTKANFMFYKYCCRCLVSGLMSTMNHQCTLVWCGLTALWVALAKAQPTWQRKGLFPPAWPLWGSNWKTVSSFLP